MKEFLNSVFEDVNGQKSSKRLITVMAFTCLSIAFIISIFTEIKLPQFMWDSMIYIVGAGLGFATVEKFTIKQK
jgi:hypothetical protein